MKLSSRAAQAVLLGLALATGIAGCTANNNIVDDARILRTDSTGLTPAEAAELERVKRYARMRSQAMTGGAILGGLTGALIGRRSGNTGVGAAAGVAGGAALGYMAGAYIARQNEVAEVRRDDLNVQLANARAALQETQTAVDVNRDIVARETSKIARLNDQYAAGAITKSQYEAEYKTTRARLEIVEGAVAAAAGDVSAVQATIEAQTAAGKGAQTGDLKATLADMEDEVDALTAERDALVAAIGTVPDEVS